jgi:hypothetical protein
MKHSILDLHPYRNACAATCDYERTEGSMNAWGNSFPAEEMPSGRNVAVHGIPFFVMPKGITGDHLESLGQTLPSSVRCPVSGAAFLCCGEMGDQELEIEFRGEKTISIWVRTKGWLVDDKGALRAGTASLVFSHLHYPGDYELSLLRPVIWMHSMPFKEPMYVEKLTLGFNPLFHVFAITLFHS